jgi:cell division protein FtsW
MAYRAKTDKLLFFTASLLTIFGLVMVYSASSVVASSKHGMSAYYFLRQVGYAGVGFLLMVFLMNVDYRVWRRPRVMTLVLAVCIVALIVVLAQPKINGAHRWLRFGPLISLQPSEFAKLALLVFMASFLEKHEAEINTSHKRLLECLAVIGIFAGLIGLEPDLGAAVCMVLIATLLLFLAGLSWKYIGGVAALSVPVLYFAIMHVSFRLGRLKAFLDPFHDPLGSGWQISQKLTSVGSVWMFGLGLGASKQKLFFLPEAHSDFIFAVVGEELGLIGTAFIIVTFMVFFFRGCRIALRAPDRFGFFLAIGITLMVTIQAFINVSMVLAMMPTKGIALSFISQGGSSLLLNLMATGVLLNISHYGEQA